MPVGGSIWEQMSGDFATAPAQPGNYSIRACVNGMADSCSHGTLKVIARPKPDLVINWTRDKKGCCTTKRGKKLYPKAGVANHGPVAPLITAEVRYYIIGPGTGNVWWDIGNVDHLPPHELQPGASREEKIKKGWKVPKWGPKKNWHTVKVCVNPNRQIEESNYSNNCKTYGRFIK